MVRKYRVLKDSKREPKAVAGMIIYDSFNYDYGCANDDTRLTGVEHKSFTLDPKGGYPFFTMPARDVDLMDDN